MSLDRRKERRFKERLMDSEQERKTRKERTKRKERKKTSKSECLSSLTRRASHIDLQIDIHRHTFIYI